MSATVVAEPTSTDEPPKRRRKWLIVAVLAGLLAVVLFAVWLVAFSSAFGVRKIVVRGTHGLTPAQVEASAAIKHGTPLVRLNTAAVTHRVERLPDVASAQVRTSFPSTVTITVTERVSVGYVRSGGEDVLLDQTGTRYRTVSSAPRGLPKLVVPDSGTTARSAARAVAQVAAALPAKLLAQVGSIQALEPTAITLVLRDGTLVDWGTSAQTPLKATVLPTLLKRGADEIDVTDPTQPFTH